MILITGIQTGKSLELNLIEMKKKIRHKLHNLTTDFFGGEAGIELKPRNMKTCSYPTN